MIHKHPEGLSCGCAYAERLETKVVALADEVERLRAALRESRALVGSLMGIVEEARIGESTPLLRYGDTVQRRSAAALNSSTEVTG